MQENRWYEATFEVRDNQRRLRMRNYDDREYYDRAAFHPTTSPLDIQVVNETKDLL